MTRKRIDKHFALLKEMDKLEKIDQLLSDEGCTAYRVQDVLWRGCCSPLDDEFLTWLRAVIPGKMRQFEDELARA